MVRRILIGLFGVIVASIVPGTVEAAARAREPQNPGPMLSIGLLLLAIDAQPDHLRIAEAMRVSNPGPPLTVEVRVVLPPGAANVAFHRGLRSPRDTADGFADTMHFATGLTEIAYSYAVPAAASVVLSRVFPFPVHRLEIVAHGAGLRLRMDKGVALPPLEVGNQQFTRWEVRGVPAGAPVAVALDGLPVSPTWLPAAAATVLAAVLAAGLVTSAVKRNKRTHRP